MNDKYIQDFNTALNIYENDYSHEDLIYFLKNGSDVEKQIAALKVKTITTPEEADIFISNLTGCDGKIREAVSFRLKEFISANPQIFTKYTDIFLDAIIDINGNICRNSIYALKNLKEYSKFCHDFCRKVKEKAIPIAKKVKEFDIQEGKYKINKEIFKLYWYLETISEFSQFIDKSDLKEIILEAKDIKEYTIREKIAKILSKIDTDTELLKIKEDFKNDPNYYVRRVS